MYDLIEFLKQIMKKSIFWDIAPCSPVPARRRLGETYHLHLQGPRVNQARNQHEAGRVLAVRGVMSLRNIG
jgi:hypothetical protein